MCQYIKYPKISLFFEEGFFIKRCGAYVRWFLCCFFSLLVIMMSSKILYRALSRCGGVVVLVGGVLGAGVSSVEASNVRDLEGVDIISREEW